MMKTKNKLPFIGIVKDTLRHTYQASPAVFLLLAVCSLLFCGQQVLELFFMRSFFDEAAAASLGKTDLMGVLAAGIPLGTLLLLTPLLQIAEFLAQGYFWRRGSGHLLSLFHLRAGKLPLLDFETNETFDEMKKAELAGEGAPAAARSILQLFFYYLPYLIFTSFYLFTIKPLLVVILLFLFLTVLLSQLVRAKKTYGFENENAGLKRQVHYFESCITGREYFKETRTLGAFGYFFEAFQKAANRYSRSILKTQEKIAIMETLLRIANVLGYAGILCLLVFYLGDGSISVGAFASIFYSVERVSGVLKRMVEDIGEALSNMHTSSFYFHFLRTKEIPLPEMPLDPSAGIRIDNVSFAYPDGKPVLQNISLEIARGETLAIVGENGAGKTTLTKLIIGLYPPTQGKILCGNLDLNAWGQESRFLAASAVFQNFCRYKLSLSDNVRISQMDSLSPVNSALTQAGVCVQALSSGLDTLLSREFGGAELSGGQWQRVAIARGLYREFSRIILDEPTAAIDPLEESSLFTLFRESARDKTAILVTHRLGSVKIADKIVVLDGGMIAEQGAHAELMALRGKYFRMYTEQAKWYHREGHWDNLD